MSIRILEKDSGRLIGTISEEDLQVMIDYMEEESSTDTDYFVEQSAIGAMESLGASPTFVSMLRGAVGNSEGIDIKWVR